MDVCVKLRCTSCSPYLYVGNWREQLLRYIDADQLPKYWGGTAVDPDGNEYCKSKVQIVVYMCVC